jgi:cytochrome oxidase assembly protein ShyY1
VLEVLRQRRYLALSALMAFVALACIAAGTWQITRELQKHDANNELRHNAHAAPVPVDSILPLVTAGPSPAPHAVKYRTVTASGRYDAAHQGLVRQRTVNGDTGYLVLTPLRTAQATLLVVRGFISGTSTEATSAPPPPSGQIHINGRVQPAETRSDHAAALPTGQLESINPVEQAARLGTPVFAGYVELLDGQPGTAGLVPMPAPDLSNPAGGAVEPQHIAYIVQWFVFAGLALAAPLVMVRAEQRRESGELGARTGQASDADDVAARLADRYGRPRLRARSK